MKNELTLTEKINEVLYKLDPMGTCCFENEVHDEYLSCASRVRTYLDAGLTVRAAIDTVFNNDFWVGAVQGETKENLVHAIDTIIA